MIVRLRPLDEHSKGTEFVRRTSDRTLVVENPRQKSAQAFQYDQCFDSTSSQDDMFSNSGIIPILDHVLEGYSSTVFAYGPTGSGKTFTVAGIPEKLLQYGAGDDADGIVIRSIECLFEKIRSSEKDGGRFLVRASCVEIYNESLIDLISPNDSPKRDGLQIKFHPSKGSFFIHDLSYGTCKNEKELMKLYMRTLRNRSVASHDMNRDSSRSHALFTIYVDSVYIDDQGAPVQKYGKISFVDLAGSERLKESHSTGKTLRETGHINRSIFTLGKVISSLCDRRAVNVPFRESKLTQILKDSLGGTSLTIMIVCISPGQLQLHESIKALEYGNRVKTVKNKPAILLDEDRTMVMELKKEIGALRAENMALKDILASRDFGDSARQLFPDAFPKEVASQGLTEAPLRRHLFARPSHDVAGVDEPFHAASRGGNTHRFQSVDSQLVSNRPPVTSPQLQRQDIRVDRAKPGIIPSLKKNGEKGLQTASKPRVGFMGLPPERSVTNMSYYDDSQSAESISTNDHRLHDDISRLMQAERDRQRRDYLPGCQNSPKHMRFQNGISEKPVKVGKHSKQAFFPTSEADKLREINALAKFSYFADGGPTGRRRQEARRSIPAAPPLPAMTRNPAARRFCPTPGQKPPPYFTKPVAETYPPAGLGTGRIGASERMVIESAATTARTHGTWTPCLLSPEAPPDADTSSWGRARLFPDICGHDVCVVGDWGEGMSHRSGISHRSSRLADWGEATHSSHRSSGRPEQGAEPGFCRRGGPRPSPPADTAWAGNTKETDWMRQLNPLAGMDIDQLERAAGKPPPSPPRSTTSMFPESDTLPPPH